ncbi:Hypothetical predicted protein [Cloeon dipterum]|uniref:Uncharacterized protein n=1 Tax=Cloeon dipterum TaxID=197152 RepID=A0A8S1D4D6_9INSE|nr:Hypothetical predicted protein [Cloeon dipterum]
MDEICKHYICRAKISYLEKLSLIKMCLTTSTLPIEFFTELKELEWKFFDERYGVFAVYESDAMILSNILSAPKLEKVVLEGARFNKEDLIGLNSLIQEKKILSQLHTFHFYLNTNANENFEDLTNLLKSACAYLPKLSELKIGRKGDFQDPFVTCAIRKDDSIFDKCMRSLLYLLEFQ